MQKESSFHDEIQAWKIFLGQMKQEAETCLLRAQRDRGSGLYFGMPRENAPVPLGFQIEFRDRFAVLTPKAERILAFQPGDLSGSELLRLLSRQIGYPVSQQELELCCLGVKKMEEKTTAALWQEYEKQLRQLAAVCLRTGHGGLLWASALCLECGRLN